MLSGYPRFYIHSLIQKLEKKCLDKFGAAHEKAMLFPSERTALRCRQFLDRYYVKGRSQAEIPSLPRIAEYKITTDGAKLSYVNLFIVLFPQEAFPIAKQFWQHTGDGISSRMAEYCLRHLSNSERAVSTIPPADMADNSDQRTPGPNKMTKAKSSRYGSKNGFRSPSSPINGSKPLAEDLSDADHMTYVEERYGRNLASPFADRCKVAIRRRIAGIVIESDASALDHLQSSITLVGAEDNGHRGVGSLSEDDVYLFPCGMSAIFNTHRFLLGARGDRKSVCFGFPYIDTLKVLQKWGPGCHFFGHGEASDIDQLEKLLQSGERILALFTEFPSNPLLKSADLHRLRTLADQYDFAIIVDETVGNFVNVAVLEWADVVVSSLTKIFSGDSNVMGGSMVLNPNRRYYESLKQFMANEYEDLMWAEDAIFLERNSRDFKDRSHKINQNAEAVCEFLQTSGKVVKVFYPKFTSTKLYEACKTQCGGYGGLFSILFDSEKRAEQFFDALAIAKGPSLGTNFTLACPYTILAHYTELDWAKQFGVAKELVRVSVGLEDRDQLVKTFANALEALDA
ncbi:hypothetical protein BZG36_05502 [Bifiguratus adelaidae]|uniref:cystathionine gamma-synthase n=1 Tax=Bifiguratus adelaidae TaxID=1938954 RepID=A0A261XT92_9FUNG|nr:hypothetical protein BZG36_05502 [Bifiguratus adelaidae]